MKYYTDMAFERVNSYFKADNVEKINGEIEKVSVNIDSPEKSRYYGKPEGRYVCYNIINKVSLSLLKRVAILLSDEIRGFLKVDENISLLVIGLGNNNIICDKLGNLVCDGLIVNESKKINKNLLFSFCPGVKGKTGIDSISIIKELLNQTGANAILLVDSFYTLSVANLGNSFQISDGGIRVNGEEFTKQNLGVPVVVLGCPFAIKLDTVINKVLEEFWSNKKGVKMKLDCLNGGDNVVTLLNINEKIKQVASLLASSINMAIYNLTFEDCFVL